ncbi:MAG: TlpA family protein disulfide reductase [Betaproteobacteria bacterium]|nr:TlpA family protein disulfide reductase [Betaproteobacteria bacterium]
MPRLLIGLIVGLVAILAGLALWLNDYDAADRTKPLEPTANVNSAVIYATSFPDITGRSQSLGQWQKKLLILNFWATWCAPCKEEMPLLAELQAEFGSKGLQIVGIAVDSPLNVSNFQKTSPVNYPLLPDEGRAIDFSKRLGNRLGLLPYTIVVAPGGEVIFRRMGPVTKREMSAFIAQNIAK